MKVTQEIAHAIRAASEAMGGLSEMERRTKVSKANLSRYLSGKTLSIQDDNWGNILPFLKFYLPKDRYDAYVASVSVKKFEGHCNSGFNLKTGESWVGKPSSKEVIIPLSEDDDFKQKEEIAYALFHKNKKTDNLVNEAIPVRDANVQFRAVPVLSIAQAAGYEPAVEPLCDYLRETSDKTALFFDVADNCFALEVSGDSMAPDYPNGSIALVSAGDYPQRGDIVAAKLNDGQVVIKEYHRCNNIITLQSINPDGKNFEWHCKEQPGYVQWMWPVIEVILKPRDRRWAQRRMGV